MKKYLLLILLLMLFPAQMAISKDKYVMDNGVRIKIPTKFEKKLLQNVDENGEGFYEVGELLEGRYFHAATLLQDGRVFISGGIDIKSGIRLWTTEIFDPATGKSIPGPNMNYDRFGHFTHLMPDGRVLIFGGDSQDSYIKYLPVDIYDPKTNTIEQVGELTKLFSVLELSPIIENINENEIFIADKIYEYYIFNIKTNKLTSYDVNKHYILDMKTNKLTLYKESYPGISPFYIGKINDILYAISSVYFLQINKNNLDYYFDKKILYKYKTGTILPDKKNIMLYGNGMAIYSIKDKKLTKLPHIETNEYKDFIIEGKIRENGNLLLYSVTYNNRNVYESEIPIGGSKFHTEKKSYKQPLTVSPYVRLSDGRLLFPGGKILKEKYTPKVYVWCKKEKK